MKMTKRLTTAALAGAFGLGLFATASLAGPIMLGPISVPVTTPKAMAVPIVHSVPIKTQVLNTYRQVRAFWISRAIVR